MSMFTYDPAEVDYDENDQPVPMPVDRCLNFPSEQCRGRTRPRTSRSGLTHSLKCDGCQDALDVVLDEIDRRYPDSPIAPDWFSPAYAGENWDDD